MSDTLRDALAAATDALPKAGERETVYCSIRGDHLRALVAALAAAEQPAAPAFPVIALGHGLVEVANGTYQGLPALIFGRYGTGVIGEPTQPNREHKPGETLAVVTFANTDCWHVVEHNLRLVSVAPPGPAQPGAAPATALDPVDWASGALREKLSDLFSIGSAARSDEVILTNAENTLRRSKCLSAIEHEFFMRTVVDDDGEESEDTSLNWGHEPAEYVEQFRSALAELSATPQPDASAGAQREALLSAATAILKAESHADYYAAWAALTDAVARCAAPTHATPGETK